MTAPARTVVDLRRTMPPAEARRAIRQAEFRGLRLGGTETDGTRTDLERDLLGLCGARFSDEQVAGGRAEGGDAPSSTLTGLSPPQ